MEFAFTEEQLLVQRTFRQFAYAQLLPNYARWDRGESISKTAIHEVATLGIFGLRVPQQFGGEETDYVTCGVICEELSRGDFNYGLFLQLGMIAAELPTSYAQPDVQAEWLPRLATGYALIAFAVTERGAGSDAASITTTRAVRAGDAYVITGEKASISFAGCADAAIVFARTSDQGARGISAFLVPLDAPGIARQIYKSPGMRLTQRGSLFFDQVRIPARYRHGEVAGAEGRCRSDPCLSHSAWPLWLQHGLPARTTLA